MFHFTKKTTKRRCPMCGGKKLEFGYEALTMIKVDLMGGANVVEMDKGRVMVFVECMDCGHYMFLIH